MPKTHVDVVVLSILLGIGILGCSDDPSQNNGANNEPTDGGLVAPADSASPDDAAPAPTTVPAPSPMTPTEIAAASARLAGTGIEVFEDPITGNVIGISGRLGRDVHANGEAEAGAAWLTGFGRKAWGWTATGSNIGDVGVSTAEQESYPIEKSDQQNQLVVRPVRYVQLHVGVPIETRNGVVIVGVHSRDLAYVIGGYVGNLGPDPVAANASSMPSKTVLEALTEAAKDPRLAAYNLVGPNGVAAMYKGRLVWSEVGTNANAVLAYRVLLDFPGRATDGTFTLLVDASSGALLEMREGAETDVQIMSAATITAPIYKGTSPKSVPGSYVKYTPLFFGGPRMGNAIAEHIPGSDTTGVFFASGPTDPKEPYLDSFVDDPFYQPLRHATDAYGNARTTFTWLKDNLGWRGVDGSGAVDVPLYPFTTSEWNASADPRGHVNLHSGLGSHASPASVGLSVLAHEIGHQILRWTNPLDYRNESGALNEALADFTGGVVRGFPSLIADDVDDKPSSAIRNLADPTAFGQPDRYLSTKKTPSSTDPSRDNDYGGVHQNSGIINKAHWLMVRGSKGAPFQGFEVTPLADTVSGSVTAGSQLVYSALFAGMFPSTTTLPQYGAGLYSFCRAQTAMWKGLALTTEGACGTVHDALVATELIGASNAPTDLAIEADAVGDDLLGKLVTKLRIYNSGTARYEGPVRFDLRSEGGADLFDTLAIPKATYQPKSKTETTASFSIGDIAKSLPYDARLTISVSPGADGKTSNNTVTLRLKGEAVPSGDRSTILLPVAGKAGVRVSAARDGNCPLKATNIGGRLLYRKKGSTKFEWGGSPSTIVRFDGAKAVPYLQDVPGIPIFAEPLRDDFAAFKTVAFATWDREIVTPTGDVRKYGILTVNKDATLRTATGGVIDDDLVFVAFDYDGRMNITGSETLLYCINCDASDPSTGDHFAFTGVTFQADTKLGDILPSDLAVTWAALAPVSIARPPIFMNPGWQVWLKLGGFGFGGPGLPGDPPILSRGLFRNTGP